MTKLSMRKLPLGFIGAIVLIVCVERTISSKITSVTTEVASCWSFAAKAAGREAKDSEILGFGDSLMKYGFQPKVIEARTGRSAYNLAAFNGPPSRDYLMLKRVLDAGGNPSAIVACFQVVHFGSGPRFHARQFAESVTLAETLDLAWTTSDPSLFAWLMLSRHVPSIRARFELRGNLMTALTGQGMNWAEIYAIFRRNWNQSRGAHIGADEPHAPESTAALARAKELYGGKFEDLHAQTPVHEVYIHRFLDLADSHKIPVIWLIPPMLPEVEDRQREVGLTQLTTELAQRMKRAHPAITVIDGRGKGYDAKAFCTDAVHLNRRGAYALSRDLGDLLRHRLGGSFREESWVSLPPYRPGTPDVEMEDMAQSREIVLSVWKTRK